MRLKNDGKFGIGTTSPEALLNVFTASAGTWTAPTNFNDVVIESNTYAGLVIGVPDADEGLIGISSPSTNGAVGYGMLWDYDVGIGRLFTSKVGAKTRIEADNQVTQVTFDGAAGSQFAEFANDIGLKSDNSVIYFGADNDIRLTHVPDSGLSIQGTDAGAGGGPILELYRNSASPADADFLGEIYFYGEDDAGNKQEYASIKSRAVDVSSGSEDGRLELYSSLNGTMKSVFLSNNTGTPEIVINEDSEDINFRVESNSNANMLFVDAGEDRVGIGTNSPSSDLTFGGASGGIHFTDSSKGIYYDGNELVMYTTGADDFVTLNGESYVRFNTNSQEAMRILLNRNVGIGTTAPSTSLHVKNGFMRVQAGNQGSGDFTQAVGIDWSQESDSQVGKIQMVRTAWGNAPHKMEFYVRNTSSTILKTLTLENDGDGTLTGTLTESASDIRLKENINPITDALSKVKTMNGFTYTWNDVAEAECDFLDKEEVHVGLSAQDVEKVLPEVIKPAPANEKYKTIKYYRLIPLLVESIKELSAKVEYIDELEARIKTLEG